ncbi:MAG: hypothetical protein KIS88_03295 [Anaerolineales bacterium]|nr:hypothetical protein [Anaerolineales bacterium]
MNPVTQSLLKQLNNPEMDAFAADWDAVTELVIEIYQQKSLTVEQQARFFEAQERLQAAYPPLAAELEPYWRVARIKGELVVGDPFLAVLGKASAKEFVENWDAMRTLPAAREALNMLLMRKIEEQG